MDRLEALEKQVKELQETVDLLLEIAFHQDKIHEEFVNKIKDLDWRKADYDYEQLRRHESGSGLNK